MKLKKHILRIMVLCSLISIGWLASCDKNEGKTLKIAYNNGLVSEDPTVLLNSFMVWYGQTVFEPLARYEFKKSDPYHPVLTPRAAEKWQWIDSKTLRIWMRGHMKFTSGNPVRAEDVAWSIQHIKKSPEFKGLFQFVDAVKTYPNTQGMQNIVDIHMTYHNPLILNLLNYIFVMDKKFYSKYASNKQYSTTHASGSGTFYVDNWQKGVQLILIRNNNANNNAWIKAHGNVQRVIFTPIKDKAVRVSDLLAGKEDVIYPVPPESVDKIKNNPNTHIVVRPSTRTIAFLFNPHANPQLKNKLVRQAIIAAIDQEALVKNVLKNLATPTAQLVPRSYAGYNPMLELHKKKTYNLAKAKMLMIQAGYAHGFSMTIASTNNRYMNDANITQAVANMLEKIHIHVSVRTMPKDEYFGQTYKNYKTNKAGMLMIGWQSDTLDANNFYETLMMCHNFATGDGTYNVGLCNKTLNTMIIKARTIRNKAQRNAFLKTIATYIYDHAMAIPLYQGYLVWGVRNGINWKDIHVTNVLNFPRLENVIIKTKQSSKQS